MIKIDGKKIAEDIINRLKLDEVPQKTLFASLSLTNGLSPEFDLTYTGYRFRINTQSSAAWTVSGYLRPTRDLSELVTDLGSVGEPVTLSLFGTSPGEPYLTFKRLWNQHPELVYRLSGLVLAMIYRTHEIQG